MLTILLNSFITQPNMYARGILFGKMKYELGDHASVKCPESGLEVDIEFKVKGWVGGSYNQIGGFIKDSSGKNRFELSGYWHSEMYIKDLSTGKKELLFDAGHAKPSHPKSRPLEEQDERESQKLWHTTTAAIKKADQKVATDEKSRIEDEQRKEAADRGDEEWQPKLFRPAPAGDEQNLDWIINAQVDSDAPPEKQVQQILAIIPILPASEQGGASQEKTQQSTTQNTSKPAAPAQHDGGGDLIDFGQNDAPQQRQQQASSAQKPAPQQQQQLQQPLRPANSSSTPGNPIRRMDSIGNEETFMDAE